ncbi:hypothetical protein VTN02DRAFT_1967 [Thermoascus thermophilus]
MGPWVRDRQTLLTLLFSRLYTLYCVQPILTGLLAGCSGWHAAAWRAGAGGGWRQARAGVGYVEDHLRLRPDPTFLASSQALCDFHGLISTLSRPWVLADPKLASPVVERSLSRFLWGRRLSFSRSAAALVSSCLSSRRLSPTDGDGRAPWCPLSQASGDRWPTREDTIESPAGIDLMTARMLAKEPGQLD